jgi:hypothetical protein
MNVYCLLADVIVVVHLAYVAFVVVGLFVILLGWLLKWQWVRNFWFRVIHGALIGVVVFETIFGIYCPLTDWEDTLREKVGETVQQGTFIGRLADDVLFVDVDPTMMTWIYYLFGLLVLIAFFCVPPRWPQRRESRKAE